MFSPPTSLTPAPHPPKKILYAILNSEGKAKKLYHKTTRKYIA